MKILTARHRKHKVEIKIRYAYKRMIVQKTLAGDSFITTESTGHGENHRVVVFVKEKRDVGIKAWQMPKSVGIF